MQGLDLEQPALGGTVVAALRALLLVASGAERPVSGPCERDHAHRRVRRGPLEAADQLLDGVRGERVQTLWPVDRDPAEALLHLVAHVGQLGHPECTLLPVGLPPKAAAARAVRFAAIRPS